MKLIFGAVEPSVSPKFIVRRPRLLRDVDQVRQPEMLDLPRIAP
jgi:hypothetical protein